MNATFMPLTMLVFPQAIRHLTHKTALRACVLSAACLAFSAGVGAVKADRDEPLSFAADSARVDEA